MTTPRRQPRWFSPDVDHVRREHRARDEHGQVSALVVLFPLFVVCVYAMVQAIQWRHDRQYALAIAQESAAAVALYHGDHNAVVADATSQLTRAGMGAVTVTVTGDAATVVVHVHADAPGILIGTSSDVDVAAAAPNERLTP